MPLENTVIYFKSVFKVMLIMHTMPARLQDM